MVNGSCVEESEYEVRWFPHFRCECGCTHYWVVVGQAGHLDRWCTLCGVYSYAGARL